MLRNFPDIHRDPDFISFSNKKYRDNNFILKSKLIVIFAIAVQLLWSPAACPSGLDELSYTFKFPAPVITRAGEYDTVTMAGCEPWYVAGQPIVPFKGRAVLVPEGREIAGIRFETGEKITLPGRYYLEPAGPPFPLSRPDLRRDATPDPETYASSLPYPSQVLSGENLQQKSGYSILFFDLFPVSYLPFPRELSYYRSIRVIITLKDPSRKRAARFPTVRGLSGDREAVAALVINPKLIPTYRPPPRRAAVDPLESYSHVIITGSALASSFEALKDHRISRGVSSTIVTVEDIAGDPDYRWDGTFGDGVSWADDTAARNPGSGRSAG